MRRSLFHISTFAALGLLVACSTSGSNNTYSAASTGPMTAGGATGIASTGTDTAAVVSATGDPTAGTTAAPGGTPATGY